VSSPTSALTRNVLLSAATLVSSAGTLVCCVLPALLVALGAGAALAGLVTAVPQLAWLSEHKPLVFGIAAALLATSGTALWYGRSLPCPTEPAAARACQSLRRLAAGLYGLAVVFFLVGTVFAFVLPTLRS
jgi:hypothetical protein